MLGMANNAITSPILSGDIQQQLNQAKSKQALIDTTGQQLRNLMQASQARTSQIQGLMGAINQTNDTKGISELTARIQAEQVMTANEGKEAQLLYQLKILQHEQRDEDLKEESRKVLRRTKSAFDQ
jgi:N-acetylneuraminic acid mutarotase